MKVDIENYLSNIADFIPMKFPVFFETDTGKIVAPNRMNTAYIEMKRRNREREQQKVEMRPSVDINTETEKMMDRLDELAKKLEI